MPTTALVVMKSPAGEPDTGFYVHYDGGSIKEQLTTLLARDGYLSVFERFRDQPSRWWREITPEVTTELPEYVARFAQNIPRCRPVAGYGVLLVGAEELARSAEQPMPNLAKDCDHAYRVDQNGRIHTVR